MRIQIGTTEMIVDSSDVDRANSNALNRVNDVAILKYLNETSVIHLLRQRYGANLLFTKGGIKNMIYILPTLSSNNESDEKLFHENNSANLFLLFRGCKRNQMPAHMYSTVQQVYQYVYFYYHYILFVFKKIYFLISLFLEIYVCQISSNQWYLLVLQVLENHHKFVHFFIICVKQCQ